MELLVSRKRWGLDKVLVWIDLISGCVGTHTNTPHATVNVLVGADITHPNFQSTSEMHRIRIEQN